MRVRALFHVLLDRLQNGVDYGAEQRGRASPIRQRLIITPSSPREAPSLIPTITTVVPRVTWRKSQSTSVRTSAVARVPEAGWRAAAFLARGGASLPIHLRDDKRRGETVVLAGPA